MLEFLKEYWFLVTFAIGMLGGAWQAVSTLNNTLLSIKHQLEVSNRQHKIDVDLSVADRQALWAKVNEHDIEIENLDKSLSINIAEVGHIKERMK